MSLRDFEAWMWADACEILDRADRLHRHFFRPTVMNVRRPTWEPPVDIYETRNDFKIVIAMPGAAPELVSVMLDQGYLMIEGQRRLPTSAEAQILRLEIPYGRFERRIELPNGRFEIGDREFINGCLVISLRKI